VTMLASKPGLETPYAFAFCGTVRVAPIADIEPFLAGTDDKSIGGEKNRTANEPPRAATGNARKNASATSKNTANGRDGRRLARGPQSEFFRAEAEDDDGYDPYSDRRPEPEPLFQRDPWN
ncbi:MAG: DNA-deoxyinosine glycosylase, partial [Slackia sp.]|nr:DNA-deoxyinosine glycosylase [Slackia sp.]